MDTVKYRSLVEDEESVIRYYPEMNPALTGKVPDGYMTGKEFVRTAKEQIRKYYTEHGLLLTQ